MAEENDKPRTLVKRLAEYTDTTLDKFENRRARRMMDVVDEMEADRVFTARLKTRARAWLLMVGMFAAAWTAIITLKGPLRDMLKAILGPGP